MHMKNNPWRCCYVRVGLVVFFQLLPTIAFYLFSER